ncbi:hypothetical protein AUK22_00280 [bacterium CG2_30_54_10]|nr:MAG: hypothetical protein AUK22_00280 [bacterium CG2_30_54_10]
MEKTSSAHWLSGRRVFRLFLKVVVLPALFLALLEGGLRLLGYGFTTNLFLSRHNGNDERMVINCRAGWQYFSPDMDSKPLPEQFSAKKGIGVFRVFVLGESTSRGEFLVDFSFSRMLREMLEISFPETRFEIINTGISGINSWALKEFSAQIGRYQPDLVILYAGHDEVVGPFGPQTVSGPMLSRAAIRTNLWFSGLRISQFARSTAETLGLGTAHAAPAAPAAPRGHERFIQNLIQPQDPRLKTCISNFQTNVEEIINNARESGAGVIVCQVPSNLADCPPFASRNRSGLTSEEVSRFETFFRSGTKKQEAGNFSEAAEDLNKALSIDPNHAESWYRLGKCLFSLGKTDEARRAFTKARDNDALCFRAIGDFNSALASACRNTGPAPETSLLNLEKVFSRNSPGKITGKNLVYDHVHLTLDGHYLVATALFQKLLKTFLNRIPSQSGKTAIPSPDKQKILERLGFTPFDELKNYENILALMKQPPFTSQSNNADTLDSFRKKIAETRQALRGSSLNLIASCGANLELDPENPDLLMRMARLYVKVNKPEESLLYYDRAIIFNPFDIDAFNQRGQVLLALGRLASATADFRQALGLAPDFAGAHFNLGIAYSRSGKNADAIREYNEALRYDPSHLKARLNLGNILFSAGKTGEAISQYQAALAIASDSCEAHLNLGNAFLKSGEAGTAMSHYSTATTLDPMSVNGFYGLGNAMTRVGRDVEALQNFRTALSIDSGHIPSIAKAAFLLATSENPKIRNPKDAIGLAEQAASLSGKQEPRLLQILAVAYAGVGRTDDARKAAQSALELAEKDGDQALCRNLRENIAQLHGLSFP